MALEVPTINDNGLGNKNKNSKSTVPSVDPTTGKAPVSGVIIEYTGNNPEILNSETNKAAQKTKELLKQNAEDKIPEFKLSNGQVSISGGKKTLNHPIVAYAEKELADAFKGADFTDKDVAAAFQKAVKQINEQIKKQIDYERYKEFLDRSGFSEKAYNNYAIARQETDNNTNPTKSKTVVATYDKNGKLVEKTIEEWFDYWKKEYTPEDRGMLWQESLAHAYNPTEDFNLYKAIPALLMGHEQGHNYVQGFFQWLNPFDDADGVESAKTVTPKYGFDDTNPVSVAIQSGVAQFGRALPGFLGAGENVWESLGYGEGQNFFTRIPNWDDSYLQDWTAEDFQDWAEIAHSVIDKDGLDTYDKIRESYGDGAARNMLIAYTITERHKGGVGNGRLLDDWRDAQGNIISKAGDYAGYQEYKDIYDKVSGNTPAKRWDSDLQDSIEKFATYNPNAATFGAVAGQIARITAEQAALSLISGGMLSASNIAKTLTGKAAGALGKLGKKGAEVIGLGQKVAAMSPEFAKAINGLAAGSAEGLTGASKAIYTLGSIAKWAGKVGAKSANFVVREGLEDVLRGSVDDLLTRASFDSQGNLDPNKFVENVYMNAIMAGIGKLPGTIGNGIFTMLDAEKNIDGVNLSGIKKAQMNELVNAVSDNSEATVKEVDADGHPIITKNGQDKVLDQIVLTKENAEKVNPEQAPTKTIEDAAFDGNKIDEEVADTVGKDPITTKTELESKLNDDAIRRKFPNGKVMVNGEEVILDTKNPNMADIHSANGSSIKNLTDGVTKLVNSVKHGLRSFQESMNGIAQHMDEFVDNWDKAVRDFAEQNNVEPRDVIIALRDLRIDGTEAFPGLKQLWEENWKPMADKLLDAQDNLTNIKTNRQDYYQRDMVADTFKVDENGKVSIDQGTIDELLGTENQFDITASSTKRNRQNINDDILETDPKVLAQEFVMSRLATIRRNSKQGQTISVMREALQDGEVLTADEAAKSLDASKKIGRSVRNSEEVQAVGKTVTEQTPADNIEELSDGFGKEDMAKLNNDIKAQKAKVKDLEAKAKEANSVDTKKADSDALRDADAKRYSREEVHTPETERIKMDIAQKTGTDLDETPFKVLDDDNGEVVRMLDERPGATREGSLRDYNRDYKGQESKVILVDPNEYTRVLTRDPSSNTSADTAKNIEFDSKTNKYVQDMQNGDKFPVPYIKYNKSGFDGQEGRHRAMAAARAGYDKIPVAVSVPAGKTPKDVGFRNYDDITDDVAKIVTENNRVKNAEYEKTRADIEAKQKANEAEKTRINNELASEKQKLADLEKRKAAAEKIEKAGDPNTEAGRKARGKAAVNATADAAKEEAEKAQDNFEKAANKSNVAEEISKSSGYKKRAAAQKIQNPIGVNFLPGNPFGRFASWVNDNFVKSQSIQIKVGDNTYSAYSGGYSLYAEAPSWARKVIISIRNGKSFTDAVYDVVSQNGIKIEPTDYAIKKYGALTSAEKDAQKAAQIVKDISESKLFSKAVKDGTVVDSELLGSLITRAFKRQGANEFMRFLKKSDFGTFRAGEQKWLNAQAYKIMASFDAKTYKGIKAFIRKSMMALMSAKYRSNMYGNIKNAQLQLTEIQRLFTLNKLGDFTATVRRLITDQEFRNRISDAAYIYASDSLGQGLSKQDLRIAKDAMESYLKTADASSITAKGVLTSLSDKLKDNTGKAIEGVDNDMLGAIQGAEYFKNYMLLAGIVQSADAKGLKDAVADAYIRNRFNTEAIAGNEIGHIGLTDSSIGRLAFMYLGFPIRELTLQAHIIKGGGNYGGTTKLDKALGGFVYANKALGAKGVVWALEAPWGYKFADVMGYDPFGVTDERGGTEDNKNVDPWMRIADAAVKYNPFLQGAITSAFVDIYMAYRESYEDAKDEWLETHDDLSEFDWNFDDAPQDKIWSNIGYGFAPGYTAFSRGAMQAGDLDRGYGISSTGNAMYQTNTEPGNVAWGFIAGRGNTPNAQAYYQTPRPIDAFAQNGLSGLGQAIERAMPFRLNRGEGPQIGTRNFREFDPIDSYSYEDWFDGSWADQQNWSTGYYAFRDEAEEIARAANEGVTQSNALEHIATRETQLADLRDRVQRYVQAYLKHHPEGISNSKMQQIQRIFNLQLPDANTSLNRVLGDYSNNEADYAQNRVAAGDFPTPYGMTAPYKSDTGEVVGDDYGYSQSAKLKSILESNQYGIQSNAALVIKQLDDQNVPTPYGLMTFKDFRKKTQADINAQYDSGNPDYDEIARLQSRYLDAFDTLIRPIFDTYGSALLNAGQSSDIMQEFGAMLNGLIPSEEYRVDKKGRRIRQSTPYMRVDIKKWLQKNYGHYPARNTTDYESEDRLRGIRVDMDAGRTAVARAKTLAFIEDLKEGKVSVDRGRLEELQNILRGTDGFYGGATENTRLTK